MPRRLPQTPTAPLVAAPVLASLVAALVLASLVAALVLAPLASRALAVPSAPAGAIAASAPAAAVPPSPTPNGPAPSLPPQGIVPETPRLRELRAAAERRNAELLRRTRDYEAAVARADDAARRAAQLRDAAARAAAEVASMRVRLERFVAASYRTGGVTEVSVILSTDVQPADVLQGVQYVRSIRRDQNVTLAQLTAARARADALAAQARKASDEAAREAQAVEHDRQRLADMAKAAATALAREVARAQAAIEAELRAEARARSSAGVVQIGWGGFPNGLIPPSALCPIPSPGQALQCDAARAFTLLAAAYAKKFGSRPCVTDSYRSYDSQVAVYALKPALAAVPGTSNHGWGLALDLCGGIERFGTPQHAWMRANAGRFGWVHPAWAEPDGSRPEPWHWEFGAL